MGTRNFVIGTLIRLLLREVTMKLLIVIPAYNEAESIERVVGNIIAQCPNYDYLVVNDGSKDNTVEICKLRGYRILDLPVNLGLSGAVQAGMIYAFENGYDGAVQFDGDGQHRAEYIQLLVDHSLKTGADIVIGSRFKTQKKACSLRMLGSNLIQLAICMTTGQNITDPTSGMRLYSRRVLREYSYNLNYTPEPDTIAFLIHNQVSCDEIQVEMDERVAGESYLNLKNAMVYMMKMILSIVVIQWFRKRA